LNITASGTYEIDGTTFTVNIGPGVPPLVSFNGISVNPSDADSFLQILFGKVRKAIPLDSLLTWSPADGAKLDGLPGDTYVIPINQNLAVVTLKTLTLHFEPAGTGVQFSAALDGSGGLGPFQMSVQGIGVLFTLSVVAGPSLQITAGFKAPTGLGAVMDAGPITGGGFLSIDQANGRYAGILQLQLFGIGVTAIGLLDTKVPGGFSFLVILTATFEGLQIGFGFTLNGVGGIVGLDRTIHTDPLRNAVLGHHIDHILFAQDPVAHAAEIISDLRDIFPPASDEFVFGPMVKMGWGTPSIAEVELGFILDLPAGIFVILGQISCFFPTPEVAVVELHLDFDGVFDPAQKTLSLTASLHDSRVELYTLRGDMAFQLTWGDSPSFLFSLGGFNPHFQPPPAFPALQRLSLELGFGDNPRISMQNYLAVTSNSYQFGAKGELYAAAGPFNLHGWMGFDALLIFSPLSFIVDFDAGIDFREDDNVLASLTVHASLSGPRPWHVEGEASISIFFVDASVNFTATIGDTTPASVPPAEIKPALMNAFQEVKNWSAEQPPGYLQVVVLQPPATDSSKTLLDPVGGAKLEQRSVPLNEVINKFSENNVDPPVKFVVKSVSLGDKAMGTIPPLVRDLFPRAQFQQMSDQQKLSIPSFELMDGGLKIASDAATQGDGTKDPVIYKTTIFEEAQPPRNGLLYTMNAAMQLAYTQIGSVAKAATSNAGTLKYAPPPFSSSLVGLKEDVYVVASMADLTVHPAVTQPVTKGAAMQALADYVSLNPAAAGTLQVVAIHEAVGA
jgi:hypothetical protein